MNQRIVEVGDCIEVMAQLPDNCVDAIVTDPPYGMSADPDIVEVLTHWLKGDRYEHGGGGFMGKTWDSFVPGPEYWRECFRVLKPGGHLLAFAAPRTYDLMAIAIRFAGFPVRDMIGWWYGTGFPKSLNVGKEIAKQHHMDGEHPDYRGRGTALKPGHEPIVMARKPLVDSVACNVMGWGTGALNIDACRIESGGEHFRAPVKGRSGGMTAGDEREGVALGMFEEGKGFDPTNHPGGRWPANVILDESAAAELDAQAGERKSGGRVGIVNTVGYQRDGETLSVAFEPSAARAGDSGGASRFFYVAKASRAERDAGLDGFAEIRRDDGRKTEHHVPNLRTTARRNHHPTVKPIALMRYLVRLVTPPGGTVLDPFCGSGTTGVACALEGFSFAGIEREAEYAAIAEARIAHAEGQIEGARAEDAEGSAA